LDDELTEVDEELTLDDDVELEVELEAADVEAMGDGDVVAVVAAVDDDEVPGMVCAPTMPSSATPATAVKAAPALSRLSNMMAALRALMRPAMAGVVPMTVSLGRGPQPIM
jgi:hypothetical protein